MTRLIQYLIGATALSASLLFTNALTLAGPGFDCAKATRQIDKAICTLETISLLDGQMADAYQTALSAQHGEAALAAAKASQKAWLAERDTRCGLDNVTPMAGSVDGLNPKAFGQFLCLQTIYPERIAQLMDITAPPLVPLDVKTVPIGPLKAAYPDDWRQPRYQALLSPDKKMMALGFDDGAGYVTQVWLYEPASGRLVVASPRVHEGKTEKPEDIAALDVWLWGEDGRFYLRADQPLGKDTLFSADMNGYAEVTDPPSDIKGQLAAYGALGPVPYNGEMTEPDRLPGFDDDSYNEQQGGAFTVWDQNRGHGAFDLLAARVGDPEPRLIASGGAELEDFQFDPRGTRLFYNGENGLLITNPETGATRRLKGTRGMSLDVRPIQMSADGEILVYWAVRSCTQDAADPIDADEGDDTARRVCLAYLPQADRSATKADPAKAEAATADPWAGEWSGGNLMARIRRGTAKPDYLVIDLATGMEGCAGAVTLYGKPDETSVLAESYDPNDPSAPVCRVHLSREDRGILKTAEAGPCNYYHGGSCSFDGSMTRDK